MLIELVPGRLRARHGAFIIAIVELTALQTHARPRCSRSTSAVDRNVIHSLPTHPPTLSVTSGVARIWHDGAQNYMKIICLV